MLIENKTDKPLTVKLPDAFAGVPVLGAERRGGAGRRRRRQPRRGRRAAAWAAAGAAWAAGMFNVPPEKIAQFKVATVCLEHGKAEPRAGIPYEIKPIESVTDKPEVQELCRMLGTGQINQRAAQAAAWHLNNGMSWQELAAKQLRHADGTSEPYFTPLEIRGGINLAGVATKAAEQRKQQQKRAPAQRPGAAEVRRPKRNSLGTVPIFVRRKWDCPLGNFTQRNPQNPA